MFFAKIINKIQSYRKKAELEDLILKAELYAENSGVAVFKILEAYAKTLYLTEPFLSKELTNMKKALLNKAKKYDIYGKYVNKTFMELLKIAENKNLPAGTLLNQFAPIYKIKKRYDGSIKMALKVPFVFYWILVFIFTPIISRFGSFGEFSAISNFIINYYLQINIVIFLFIFIAFTKFKESLPFLKSIYTKLDSILAVSICSLMYETGLGSANNIVPTIRTLFNIKKPNARNIDIYTLIYELSQMNFITQIQAAEITINVKYGDMNKIFESLKEDKIYEARLISDLVTEATKSIAILVGSIPLLLMIVIFTELIMTTANMVH